MTHPNYEPESLADCIRWALFGWMCRWLPFDSMTNAYILAQLANGAWGSDGVAACQFRGDRCVLMSERREKPRLEIKPSSVAPPKKQPVLIRRKACGGSWE